MLLSRLIHIVLFHRRVFCEVRAEIRLLDPGTELHATIIAKFLLSLTGCTKATISLAKLTLSFESVYLRLPMSVAQRVVLSWFQIVVSATIAA